MYAPMVASIINRLEVQHLLDYGCGSMVNLAEGLKGKIKHKIKYQAYDPGVPRFDKEPFPAELVCCIDVLEHIEPDRIDTVLDHLKSLTQAVIFLSIDTGPALKTLSDGRNAHLIQEDLMWWLPKIVERWDIQTIQYVSESNFFVVAEAKAMIENLEGERL